MSVKHEELSLSMEPVGGGGKLGMVVCTLTLALGFWIEMGNLLGLTGQTAPISVKELVSNSKRDGIIGRIPEVAF